MVANGQVLKDPPIGLQRMESPKEQTASVLSSWGVSLQLSGTYD